MIRLRQVLILGLSLVAVLSFVRPHEAYAASIQGWNAGYIIDDAVFTNSGSMTYDQIRAFLTSKIGTCDTNGSKKSEYNSSLTRAEYATSRGVSGPFTCLKDYTENGRSAAQIIYDVANQYRINPQVLIVLLQKEQGLLTDDWPWPIQYRSATGYGCPDTAACDSQYYGLTNQLTWSAKMFRAIMDASPTWYTPYVVGTNYIQYNPNSSCGGTSVIIANRATQALYNYTPYQPNAAALANAYGGGDSCSSYGNRNFFSYFTDWFGPATLPRDTAYIKDGVYNLTNSASGRKLDVSGGSVSDGARVWLYDGNGTGAQSWQVTRTAEGYYTLKNVASGKYLDVAGGRADNGAPAQIWSGNTGCAQKWAIVGVSSNYSFVNACSGRALDVSGGQTANGSVLQIHDRNGSGAQQWSMSSQDLPDVANGFYTINTTAWLKLASNGAGANLQIKDSTTDDTMYWQVTRQSDGTYTLRNPTTNTLLDATGSGRTTGTGVQSWQSNPGCAQKWVLSPNGFSSMTIRSACSGLSIDVINAAVSTNNTNIQLWTTNTSDAQRWIFTPLTTGMVPDSIYSLRSVSGLAVDIPGGNTANGSKMQIWDANKTSSQQWQVTRQPNGSYVFRNPQSGRYLDLTGGNLTPGNGVQIYDGNSSCAQSWNIQDNGDSTYSLLSSCASSVAIDVSGGQVRTQGSRVQLYTANGTSAQKWTFDAP